MRSVPTCGTFPVCNTCIHIMQMVLLKDTFKYAFHRLDHGLTGVHIACRTTLSVPETAGDFWMLFSRHIAPHLLEGTIKIVLLDQSAVL